MKTALRRTTRTSCWIMAAGLVVALAVAGCGDDDHDDYSETYQNCQSVDYGADGQYKLCCTVTCNYHYDDDEYTAQCQTARTCSASTGSACPDWVLQGNRYPACPYY